MSVSVSAFTALARSEFMNALIETQSRIMPADYDSFVTTISSKVRVETHTFMSNLPRLKLFKGYSVGDRLTSTPYSIPNDEWRIGPVTVRSVDLDDDQVGGYMMAIKALPKQGQKDIGYKILNKLANGSTDLAFDGSALFANRTSSTAGAFGIGNNLLTADEASNDGKTHKIIALILNSPFKPVLFQDREPIKQLQDDYSPTAKKVKEYEYWCDCRFGLGYGFWFDCIQMTITDTPTLTELDSNLTTICNAFRGFTLPKGNDKDDLIYAHEGWVPGSDNFTLLCNMGLAQLLDKIRTTELIASGTGGAVVNNQYRDKFKLIPTSALGA